MLVLVSHSEFFLVCICIAKIVIYFQNLFNKKLQFDTYIFSNIFTLEGKKFENEIFFPKSKNIQLEIP